LNSPKTEHQIQSVGYKDSAIRDRFQLFYLFTQLRPTTRGGPAQHQMSGTEPALKTSATNCDN
jgi:hypothetical protein